MGSAAPSPRPTHELVPRGRAGGPARAQPTAGCGGKLVGELAGGAVRTWLVREGAQRVLVMWPGRFRARWDPLEVIDEDGRLVARGGEFVSLQGGYLKPGDPRAPADADVFVASAAARPGMS